MLRFPFRTYATYTYFKNSPRPFSLQSKQTQKAIALTAGAAGIFYLANLHEAPISHRKRFIFVPEWIERAIGKRTYQSMIYQYQNQLLPQNHPVTIRVKNIVGRIIKSGQTLIDSNDNNLGNGSFKRDRNDDIDWEVWVINSDRDPPNAFAIPGGKIFVFSLILPICKDDDGIATVLSHEVAHQIARHQGESLSQAPLSVLGAIAASQVGLGADWLLRLLTTLPASRTMESEADYIGLMMMAGACYNPDNAPKFWQRMDRAEHSARGAKVLEKYLSTHPTNETRIRDIEKWLPQARLRREAANCDNRLDGFLSWAGTH